MLWLASIRVAVAAIALAGTEGCLVLSLNPLYDDDSIGWDPALIGSWRDADDNVSLEIQADEWRSYRIHYVHPIETGDLTGYLTTVGDHRYLDVMPLRGKDYGSFLAPVHATLRVRLDGDTLEVVPLSYDWFSERSRRGRIAGLSNVFDQKQNALITSPTVPFRNWLRVQPADGAVFGAPAEFKRNTSGGS